MVQGIRTVFLEPKNFAKIGSRNSDCIWTVFLNERVQRVNVLGIISDWIEVKRGVLQGTVLGPLCSIFMSMIFKIVSAMDVLWYSIQTIAWCMRHL